ncbi:MAG: 50S ribosomal protein L23 [Candidatus Micrarchaeota archaeon]
MFIIAPIKTEKTVLSMESNIMTFQVATSATKVDVKKEVEKLFDVKVAKVRIYNTSKKAAKRAVVKLAKGSKIENISEKLKLI